VSCRTEPGFLKLFNGQWGIEPWMQEGKQVGSKVVVNQEVLPSILPPGPLGNPPTTSFPNCPNWVSP
jgi:hypothetical protein